MTDSEILKVIYDMAKDKETPLDYFHGFVGALAHGDIEISAVVNGEVRVVLTEKGKRDAEKYVQTPDGATLMDKLHGKKAERN